MCKYCDTNRKWDYNKSSNSYVIVEGEFTNIYMGYAYVGDADNKQIQIFTYDDNGRIGFYPNYCPFCGRKLED